MSAEGKELIKFKEMQFVLRMALTVFFSKTNTVKKRGHTVAYGSKEIEDGNFYESRHSSSCLVCSNLSLLFFKIHNFKSEKRTSKF